MKIINKIVKAKVYSRDVQIGLADLGVGDYSMGGLYGIFTPNEHYFSELQKCVHLFNEKDNKDFKIWDSFKFKVELTNGYIFNPIGGIVIDDYAQMFDEPIQITLMGVACDVIDQYFY